MLIDQINTDLKQAMLDKDRVRTQTLRSIRAAFLEKEIEMRSGAAADLTDEDAMTVVQKQAKQRRDSIEQYDRAGRSDLADAERSELRIIETYLPEQLSEEAIRREVGRAIQESGAESPADMGRVMGPVMKKLKGQADGRVVQAIVKEMLSRE